MKWLEKITKDYNYITIYSIPLRPFQQLITSSDKENMFTCAKCQFKAETYKNAYDSSLHCAYQSSLNCSLTKHHAVGGLLSTPFYSIEQIFIFMILALYKSGTTRLCYCMRVSSSWGIYCLVVPVSPWGICFFGGSIHTLRDFPLLVRIPMYHRVYRACGDPFNMLYSISHSMTRPTKELRPTC
jgi:hypothetical protein